MNDEVWILKTAQEFAEFELRYQLQLKGFAAESLQLPQHICFVRECRRSKRCQGLAYENTEFCCVLDLAQELQETYQELVRILDTAPDQGYTWLDKAAKAKTPEELLLRDAVMRGIMTVSNARKRRTFGRRAAARFATPLAPPPPPRLSSVNNDQPRIDACPEPFQPDDFSTRPSLRVL